MTVPALPGPIELVNDNPNEGVIWYHPRRHWVDTAFPITGNLWVPRLIDMQVAHYTAAADLPDGDVDEHQTDRDIAPYLRRIQVDYVTNRGYSIGYWWAIDWLGGIWQLRGFDLVDGTGGLKSAANLGHNDHTAPVLFLVDGNDEPTELAMAAFRYLGRRVRDHPFRGRRTPLAVIDHGRLPIPPGTPTGCAGTGIRRVIDRGWLAPDLFTVPAPTPEETLMATIHLICNDPAAGLPEVLVAIDGAGIQIIGVASPEDRTALTAALKAPTAVVSQHQYSEIVTRDAAG